MTTIVEQAEHSTDMPDMIECAIFGVIPSKAAEFLKHNTYHAQRALNREMV